MITYEGKKYACVSCIRGHRSSSCDHKDRPLIQVRKRGRPLPENTQRITLFPDSKASSRVIKAISKATCDDNELIYTDKYVFEPAGNGLYRKHLLSEYHPYPKDELVDDMTAQNSPFSSHLEYDPQLIAPMNLVSTNFQSIGVTQEEANSIWPNGQPNLIPSCVMPDQCQCGDTCTCPDCFTHGKRGLELPHEI